MRLLLTFGIIFLIVTGVTESFDIVKRRRKKRKELDTVYNFNMLYVKEILDLVDDKARFALQDKINRNPYKRVINLDFVVDVSRFDNCYIERAVVEINRRDKWKAVERSTRAPLKSLGINHYISVRIHDVIIEDLEENTASSIVLQSKKKEMI